jgi:fucokinase
MPEPTKLAPEWLGERAALARSEYLRRIAGSGQSEPWWTAVLVTAGSERQADHFQTEIRRRHMEGKLPPGIPYLVVPDLDDERLGSGGATINALRVFTEDTLIREQAAESSLESWWARQRVLMIHAGGDPRRSPQYSVTGRLFTPLPVKTPWGDVSTVFDELLALSTAFVTHLPCGLVVAPGDVLLAMSADGVRWGLPGITGVATRQSLDVAWQHGVYALDEDGRVYGFLLKPTLAEARAAGAILGDNQVAVDTGLLLFDAAASAVLTELAGVHRSFGRWLPGEGILGRQAGHRPLIDLYQHVTLALTGQWKPKPDTPLALQQLANALQGTPFQCVLVDGHFEHVGTTNPLQQTVSEESGLSRLYAGQLRLGEAAHSGVESSGVILDSVFRAECTLDSGAVAIECNLDFPVRAGRGAVLHGLTGLKAPLDVPENVVVHQMPVAIPSGRSGTVIQAYGVGDDPRIPITSGEATWFGRRVTAVVAELGLQDEEVWPELPSGTRCLWNANLFGLGDIDSAWECARWLMGLQVAGFTVADWRKLPKLSLADSSQWVDTQALAEGRVARLQASWQMTASSLARSGSDIRPMLALSPGIAALAATGRTLAADALTLEEAKPTEAASRHFQAGLFLGQAGLAAEAEQSRAAAFRCVRASAEAGTSQVESAPPLCHAERLYDEVRISAPPRIDFGGGWSDTPPFCFDWGGTVLNMALELNGDYPIRTTIRALDEPLVRCIADTETVEYRTLEEVMQPPSPGCPFAIPRVALQMLGWSGGGLEIRSAVDLPVGSGLGTSSILAATVLRGLAEMYGQPLSDSQLIDAVTCLEQRMTTGGGWQDQAGGVYPGLKLISSGPGLRQRLRVKPVEWSVQRQVEFSERFVLHYTGIRRIAKGLLTQVVGGYLARHVPVIQVLHSIKTLAVEMAYAMSEGDWAYLGDLMRRHWELNQILDPHTTNAPINKLLDELEPHLAGAKLSGAGGGGFLMLLAKSPESARAMRRQLASAPGRLFEFRIAESGLRIEKTRGGGRPRVPVRGD